MILERTYRVLDSGHSKPMSNQRSPKSPSTTIHKSPSNSVLNSLQGSKSPGTLTLSWERLKAAYKEKTPGKIRALDAYLLYCFMTGILQLLYCIITKGKNYQSFLGGFVACVGSFVLTSVFLFSIVLIVP